MDMLPIRPGGSESIKPATSSENDGGSKSQSGYVNVRIGKEEKDEFTGSDESKRLIGDDFEDEGKGFDIKEFFLSLIRAVLKFLGFAPNSSNSQE